MALKSQESRMHRGLLWVGRAYRLAGWLGLAATAFFTVVVFFHHLGMLWNYTSLTRMDMLLQALLLGFLILITGLVLSAVAFGISLGIQVGLTMMANGQTQIALLRRLAQHQSETDSVVRLSENTASTHVNSEQHLIEEHQNTPRGR